MLFGVIPGALLFGAAALASGGLAMPIGVHAALNLARWAAGETDNPGYWSMSVGDPSRAAHALAAPFLGVVVTLAVAAALWMWHGRRRSAPLAEGRQ